MADIANTTPSSNYFLDLSKKGILSTGAYDNGVVKFYNGGTEYLLPNSSFMADIDGGFLQNFKIVYEENFGEYSDELSKKFQKLTKVLQSALKMIFKGKFDISSDSLRGTILEAQILLQYFQGVAGAVKEDGLSAITHTGTNMDIYKSLNAIIDAYNRISIYKIPFRKNMPGIKIGSASNKLTFKFAFGKCNLFNAKQEVWDPMQKLYGQLIDMYVTTGKDGIPGVVNITSVNHVPYGPVAFVDTISAITQLNEGKKDPFELNGIVKSLMDAKASLASLNGDTEKLSGYLDSQFEKIALYFDGEKSLKKDGKLDDVSSSRLNQKFGLTYDYNGSQILKFEKGSWGKEWYDVATKDGWAERVSSFSDAIKKQAWNVILNEGKAGDSLGDFNISQKKSDSGNDLNNIQSVLTQIAEYDVNVVHKALANTYNRMKTANKMFYLYVGYRPILRHSLTELKKETFKYPPLIRYGPFVPKKVDMEFDMKNLDENGYPMAGSISVEPWALEGLGMSLVINEPK